MDFMFTPGCALLYYKPHLVDKTEEYLKNHGLAVERSHICCHDNQHRCEPTSAVVVCSGCARRFAKEHKKIAPVSLWQVMAEDESLSLPDYGGLKMSLHDACPTKTWPQVTESIRKLLERMNIKLIEAQHNRASAICCGDSHYPKQPEEKVLQKMKQRAAEMPTEDVAVHCISCIKSMANGGKKPRYLLDLIFNEETLPGVLSPQKYHEELDQFIDTL